MGDMTDYFFDTMYGSENEECIEIEFEKIISETDLAWQIMIDFFTIEWFPKSRCDIEDNIIYVPAWLAVRKGLV